ncbi:unnamed protein product [Coffea canephora]|uniref:Uncharacterized protein n=1 Tax=Coffea canephora TaxID=49390 RepID=A0A068U882_COFCA|nr:unnamed protein product [Coffea canephora]
MAFLSSFVACFSYSRRVGCEGEDGSSQNKSSKVQKSGSEKMKKKSDAAPIPLSYFPVGSRSSLL